jgi:hypothetical protein
MFAPDLAPLLCSENYLSLLKSPRLVSEERWHLSLRHPRRLTSAPCGGLLSGSFHCEV